VFELGCFSLFEYENWLLAFKTQYRRAHGVDIDITVDTRTYAQREEARSKAAQVSLGLKGIFSIYCWGLIWSATLDSSDDPMPYSIISLSSLMTNILIPTFF